MRYPIVAGNWKMNGTRASVAALLDKLKLQPLDHLDTVILPPFIYIQQVAEVLRESTIFWGAQNLCADANGAFTGEISAEMLREFNGIYVLVGHSERRICYKEDSLTIVNKFNQAKKWGLTPILCVGETLVQRDKNLTFKVIREQLQPLLELAPNAMALKNAIIAYEPVWAIGTGKTATSGQAQEVHAMIRHVIADDNKVLANEIRIIYGGSVKADNARQLFAMPDIDGGLIGSASLVAEEFIAICQATK